MQVSACRCCRGRRHVPSCGVTVWRILLHSRIGFPAALRRPAHLPEQALVLLVREANWHYLWLTDYPDLVSLSKGTSLTHPKRALTSMPHWRREGLPSTEPPLHFSSDTIPEEQLCVSWLSAVLPACTVCHQTATKRFDMTDLTTQYVQQRLWALTFPSPCLHGWVTCPRFILGGCRHLQSLGHTCDLLQGREQPLVTEVLRPKEARKAARMMQGLRKMGGLRRGGPSQSELFRKKTHQEAEDCRDNPTRLFVS